MAVSRGFLLSFLRARLLLLRLLPPLDRFNEGPRLPSILLYQHNFNTAYPFLSSRHPLLLLLLRSLSLSPTWTFPLVGRWSYWLDRMSTERNSLITSHTGIIGYGRLRWNATMNIIGIERQTDDILCIDSTAGRWSSFDSSMCRSSTNLSVKLRSPLYSHSSMDILSLFLYWLLSYLFTRSYRPLARTIVRWYSRARAF